MASWSTHQPSMSAVRPRRLSHRPSGSRTCSSRPCSPLPATPLTGNDFALVAMLGLLGLRIFEATGSDIGDLGEEHGHRVLRVCGKGGKIVLVPLPPAVGRAIDRAVDHRVSGPVLLNSHGTRMDRHAATRRLRRLAETAGIRIGRTHPHMLRHTFVTTMLDAGVDLRDVQIAARHADPRTTMRYDRARKNLDRHPNYILAAYMASGT
jgi:integrase/recombinase XerD